MKSITQLRWYAFFFALITVLAAIPGCTDDPPNAVGIGMLPPKDALKIDSITVAATASTTSRDRVSGNSRYLLMGRSGNLESRLLLQFPASIDTSTLARVDSAVLKMKVSYRFPASSGFLDFTMHSTRLPWTQGTFTWDSLRAGLYNTDTVVARFSGNLGLHDSIVTLRLDTAIVRQWIHARTAAFILAPSNAATMMAGFLDYTTSDSASPHLTISYHDTLDSLHTYYTQLQQTAYVANGDVPPATELMYAQGGIVLRSRLSFDVSTIPSRATVTEAVLDVHTDSSGSFFGLPRQDSLEARLNLANSSDSLSGYFAIGAPKDNSRRILTFSVSTIVQQWVSHHFPNNGFVLRSFGEFYSIDRFAMHGATAADSVRPRLKIKYSYVP